jgi:hypothetical protein
LSFASSLLSVNAGKSPMLTKKYASGKQRSKTENLSSNDDNDSPFEPTDSTEIFDDDTSKLSFKDKMTMFNQKKKLETATSPQIKGNRNRLTQVSY